MNSYIWIHEKGCLASPNRDKLNMTNKQLTLSVMITDTKITHCASVNTRRGPSTFVLALTTLESNTLGNKTTSTLSMSSGKIAPSMLTGQTNFTVASAWTVNTNISQWIWLYHYILNTTSMNYNTPVSDATSMQPYSSHLLPIQDPTSSHNRQRQPPPSTKLIITMCAKLLVNYFTMHVSLDKWCSTL